MPANTHVWLSPSSRLQCRTTSSLCGSTGKTKASTPEDAYLLTYLSAKVEALWHLLTTGTRDLPSAAIVLSVVHAAVAYVLPFLTLV